MGSTTEALIIEELAASINAWAERKGFHEAWEDADSLDKIADDFRALTNEDRALIKQIADRHRQLATSSKMMLMVSEIAEAHESLRDGDMEHLGEEYADAIIRILENAHMVAPNIGQILIDKMEKNEGRPYKHGRKF